MVKMNVSPGDKYYSTTLEDQLIECEILEVTEDSVVVYWIEQDRIDRYKLSTFYSLNLYSVDKIQKQKVLQRNW